MQERLKSQAASFAGNLSDLVGLACSTAAPFRADLFDNGKEIRCSVTQDGDTGIPFYVKGRLLLTVTAEYTRILDRDGRYMAVRKSSFAVYPLKAKNRPLFRVDYERIPNDPGIPTSHMHVHASSEGASYMLLKAGKSTNRVKNRSRKNNIPQLSDLHFPMGGARFRPCLEDFVETLINEFGLDKSDDLMNHLKEKRQEWRSIQLRTVVRDSPNLAVEQLEEMGYQITPPKDFKMEPSKYLSRL